MSPAKATITSPTATCWLRPRFLLLLRPPWPPGMAVASGLLQQTTHSKMRRRAAAALLLACLLLFLWATSGPSYQDTVRRGGGTGPLAITSPHWTVETEMPKLTDTTETPIKHGSSNEAAAGAELGHHDGAVEDVAAANDDEDDEEFDSDSIDAIIRHTPRMVRLSMLYGNDDGNEHYEGALLTHRRHSGRWGHELRILRQNISLGFWNKPNWLLSTVIQELAKPPEERLEWIMWVDADSIILNPSVPPAIFLPPPTLPQVHMVASQDHNGLNTGIMFLRVHPWTVQMLTETVAYPTTWPKADLGRSADQEAMRRVLLRGSIDSSKNNDGDGDGDGSDGGGGHHSENIVFLPRTWINAYEWASGYEGHPGDLLVHFAGLDADVRRRHMRRWLAVLRRRPRDWERPPARTGLLADAAAFWRRVRTAADAVRVADARLAAMPNATEAERARWHRGHRAARRLRDALWLHADNAEGLDRAQSELRDVLRT